MVQANAEFEVTVVTAVRPSLEEYPVLAQPEGFLSDDCYCARLISVRNGDGETFRLALPALVLSQAEPCAVLEGSILTVLLFRDILQIDLRTRSVIRCVDWENLGGLEEIYPVSSGYLIKSEGDIFRCGKALTPVWRFCGRDIFARPTDGPCFWIEEEQIHCRDWQGWHYVLDMDGKLLAETLEDDCP